MLEPTDLELIDEQPANVILYENDPPNNTLWYGFGGQGIFNWQIRVYQLNDQTGSFMPGVACNEVWDNLRQNQTYPVWYGPNPGSFETGATGTFGDYFSAYNFRPQNLTLTRPNFVLMGTLRQRIWAGSATPQIGCGPLLTAPNVKYYTNGATGW